MYAVRVCTIGPPTGLGVEVEDMLVGELPDMVLGVRNQAIQDMDGPIVFHAEHRKAEELLPHTRGGQGHEYLAGRAAQCGSTCPTGIENMGEAKPKGRTLVWGTWKLSGGISCEVV